MKPFFLLLMAAVLGGCAGLPVSTTSPELTRAWEDRQQRLSNHKSWKLVGRIAAHNDTDAWSASIHWRQGEGDYAVNIFAPLSGDSLRLYGNSSGVTMRLANGQIRMAENAETLLLQELGWRLPMEGMRHWVLGLPQPGNSIESKLDPAGRLASLRQAGWEIVYDSYLRVGGMDLPRKIYLSRPQLEVKLIIDRWELNG